MIHPDADRRPIPFDVDAAYDAAQKVVETHHRIAAFLHEGLTLAQIDRFVFETLEELGCKSCFFKYRAGGLPLPVAGLPESQRVRGARHSRVPPRTAQARRCAQDRYRRPLSRLDGRRRLDLCVRRDDPEIKKLTDSGKESLAKGIEELRPGNVWLDWARTVQRIVEDEYGFHLIRGLGGHGYGKKLHTSPWISNVVPTHPNEWPDANNIIEPGALVAVEPMIAIGTGEITQGHKQWPIYTADKSNSVHYEHDVLVTSDGPRILTDGLQDVQDVITR
ncbi:MAG: M24 family metallopeptidase [Phycisphaerales bacterium]